LTGGHNPTDRSKLGTKRHMLTDKEGIPLSTIITSANVEWCYRCNWNSW